MVFFDKMLTRVCLCAKYGTKQLYSFEQRHTDLLCWLQSKSGNKHV